MSNPEAPAGLTTPVEPRSERMTNSDFRKMLATPRAGESSSVYSSKFATPRKRTDSQAGLNEREKKKKSTSAYWKKKKQEKEEEETNKTKYRDRAEERRLGKNIDYEEAERELIAGLSTGKGDQSERGAVPNPSVPGGSEGEKTTEGYLRNLSIEQSKYLGGDEKHTHLVKGLDYALLAKMKSEMALAEENQKKLEKEKAAKTKGGEVEFRSSCARGIYDALFQKHQKQNSNRFLLGKTTFLFNTSLDRTSAPPMTVIQSVEEGGAEFDDDYFHSPVSQKILEQLKKISAYSKLGEGGKGRKREKGGKGAERGKGKNAEEKRREEEETKKREKEKEEERRRLKEESIFGDIGEYVCKIPEKRKGERETKEEKSKEKRMYFDNSTFGVMDGEGEEEGKGGKREEEREGEGEERDGEEDMKIDTDGLEGN